MTLHRGASVGDGAVRLDPPDPTTIRHASVSADVAASVAHWLAAAEHHDAVYYFSIYRHATLVGQMVLHDIDRAAHACLIAYHVFDTRNRNHGIGTTALGLLVRFVVEQTDLNQLVIITSQDNAASRHIAVNNGFVYAGTPREDPVDGVVFEWNRRK